jgi:hypothetical protein
MKARKKKLSSKQAFTKKRGKNPEKMQENQFDRVKLTD